MLRLSPAGRDLRSRTQLFIAAVALVALFGWAASLLWVHPVAGAIDRGDFHRIGSAAGLEVAPPPEGPSGRPLVQLRYEERKPGSRADPTSASLVAMLARHLDFAGTDATFDLRSLGLLYLTLTAGLFVLALHFRTPPLLCLLFGWVMVDAGYLIYFNSLYSEPPWLVATLGITLWLVCWGRAPASFWRLESPAWIGRTALLLILLLLAGMSRMPACITPLLVGVILFGQWLTRRPALTRRSAVLGAALAAVLLAPPLYFSAGAGSRFASINAFHAVFLGPVSTSREPEAVLRQLGLPEHYVEFEGESFFQARPSPRVRRAVERVSRWDIAAAYLSDPEALVPAVRRVQHQLASGATWVDYETATAAPRHAVFWRFTGLRKAVLGDAPAAVWAILAGAATLAVAAWRRRVSLSSSPAAVMFLTVTTLSQVPITILGDGLYGIGRHLLVARFAFDLLIALLLWEGAAGVERRLATRLEIQQGQVP